MTGATAVSSQSATAQPPNPAPVRRAPRRSRLEGHRYDFVEPGRAHLVVVAEAPVRPHHEVAEAQHVAGAHGPLGERHPSALRDHVAKAAKQHGGEDAAGAAQQPVRVVR